MRFAAIKLPDGTHSAPEKLPFLYLQFFGSFFPITPSRHHVGRSYLLHRRRAPHTVQGEFLPCPHVISKLCLISSACARLSRCSRCPCPTCGQSSATAASCAFCAHPRSDWLVIINAMVQLHSVSLACAALACCGHAAAGISSALLQGLPRVLPPSAALPLALSLMSWLVEFGGRCFDCHLHTGRVRPLPPQAPDLLCGYAR